MHKTQDNISVCYHPNVVEQLNCLIDALYKQGYMGSIEHAKQYVVRLREYIERNNSYLHRKPAPLYFSKYGGSMEYITYNANKRTTWYIFFQQRDQRYMICYITNNHVEGQHIR